MLEFTQEENSSFTCFHHLHQIFLPESNKTFFSYWLIFLYCCHTVLDNKVLVQAHFSSFHAQWPIFVFWCLFWMIVPWPIIRFLAQADRFIYIYMLMDESRRFFLKHSQTTCGDEGTVLIFFFFLLRFSVPRIKLISAVLWLWTSESLYSNCPPRRIVTSVDLKILNFCPDGNKGHF